MQRETGAERQTDTDTHTGRHKYGESCVTDRRRHPQLGDSFDCDGDCGCSVLLCYCCFCLFISRRWLTICKEISFSISIWHWGVGFVLAKAKSDGRLTSNKTQMAKQMEIKTKIVQTPPASLHASLNLQSHELLSCLSPSVYSPPHTTVSVSLLGHKSMLAAFL